MARRVQLIASAVQAQGDATVKRGIAIASHARAIGVPCLSSGHVFDFSTRVVAYADGRIMYEPEFLSGEGSVKLREHTPFCEAAPTRVRERYRNVTVRTRAHPAGLALYGEDAYCMQACLEALDARNVCGRNETVLAESDPAGATASAPKKIKTEL